MKNNIVFVGGIYGVGKTTISKKLLDMDKRLVYMRASQLLFEADPNVERDNKYSHEDLEYNQGLIAKSALKKIEKGKLYLFDGHYTFVNENEDGVELPPFWYFEKLNPKLFVILTESPETIHGRLKNRDNYHYDPKFLEMMQDKELGEAEDVSRKLNTPLYRLHGDNIEELKKKVKEILRNI